jgi:surface polysaccharide O-acyltransferase-like enzyme
MITGLLLLPVKLSMKDFYKKRLLRIATPFLIWSVLYNLFPWITGLLGLPSTVLSDMFAYATPDASQSFGDAMKNIVLIPFQFNIYTVHMWYLYMLVGLYLFMPIFSSWIEKATPSQKRLFLGIWALTLFLPYAYRFFSPNLFGACAWNSYGTLYYFAGFSGYLLLGHYLTKELKNWNWQKTLAISIPLFVIGYIATYIGFKYITSNSNCSEQDMELFFLYCSPNVALMTISVFLLFRLIKLRTAIAKSAFANIAKCGLGIYLVHYFVVGFGYAIAKSLAIPISIRIPITAAIVFLITWCFVATIYKLAPKFSRYVFG